MDIVESHSPKQTHSLGVRIYRDIIFSNLHPTYILHAITQDLETRKQNLQCGTWFRMLNKEFDTVHCFTNRIFRIPDSQRLVLGIERYA